MRLKRNLSSGAWAMVGWYALMQCGTWISVQVMDHVGANEAMWYEAVIMLIGLLAAIGAIVGGAATLLGVFDRG